MYATLTTCCEALCLLNVLESPTVPSWMRAALAGVPTPMKPRRVLVIDDEEDIRVLATMILEMDGDFEVSAADSGAAGIEQARRDQPDVVLLDYSMPDLDGPATFSRLRADDLTSAIPVIFLTGKAHGESRRAVDAIGAEGVMAKPVDPMSFAGELSDILDRLIGERGT